MGYEDQVRTLHGKVNIVYSNGEKLYEIDAVSSEQAIVSNIKQVVMGYSEPTCKACTMEGKCTMGGGYQMVDNSLITGWWNNVLSNDSGAFSLPYPYLEISFVKRPIFQWKIKGDEKLNHYPVNFDVLFYNGNGNLVKKEQVRDNSQMLVTLKMEETLVDITRVRLIVYRINTGKAKAKIMNFFDIAQETYEGSDLKSFEILEELATDEANVPYGINADALSIVIYNRNRKFDQGYLRELLVADRKVTPFIGIEDESGNIVYADMGTFYTDEWEVPQNELWVKCKCYDKLMRFQKITYLGYPLRNNISLKTIIEDIFFNIGLSASDYSIDSSLGTIIVPYALLGKQSAWEALQEVCSAGLCKIYLDRDNKIKVTVEKGRENNGITINPSLMFSYNKQNTNNNFSNKVEVEYTDIKASDTTTETVYSSKISIDAKSKVSITVDYSKMVSDAYLNYLPVNGIKLNKFVSCLDAGKFDLENTTDSVIVATIEIIGRVISMVTQVVSVEDTVSVANFGEILYKHPSSILVQSYGRAIDIGEYMLNKHIKNTGVLKVNWRGDPALKLEDKFTCVDRFGNSAEYVNQYNRFVFDGGLKQEIKAKEVKDG